MPDLDLLIEKIPPYWRQGFIEGLKSDLAAEISQDVLQRLVKNVNKINWMAYLAIHTDIAQKGYNPILHYLCRGWRESRQLIIVEPASKEKASGNKTVLSCKQLRNGLVYEGGSLYSCCAVNCGRRPFLTKVNEDGSFNIQEVVETRKQIEKELNTPGANPVCKGCPLVEELPDCSPDDEEIYYICKGFNLGESHHCNFRCAYCAFNKQGLCAEPRRVTMAPIIKFLLENRMLADDAYISIAGGEPLLMPDFDESLNLLVQSGEKAITVNTNLSVWSNALAEALRTGNVLIRCSVDSGTPETFGKLKGRDLFWRVVENINRYASIDPDQVILKYICLHDNCNDSDLLGALNILNYARNRLLIDFDYYEPPDRRILRFAGKFKALADLNGVNADIRYDAELNWPRPIHLRKRLDAYELLHLGKIFKYSNGKLIRSGNYRSASQLFRGYVDILQYDERNGLSIAGWAWDHVSGAPQAIRVYAGNQIVFVGKPHTVRIDIEAGARAGFTFRRQQNPVLRNIMANGAAPEVFATFDGLKWDKLPVGADAANSQPMS